MAKIASKSKSASAVTFSFEDKAKSTIVASLAELPDSMITELALHGLSQKIGDSYSGVKVVSEALASAKAVWENLKKGQFNSHSSGSGILAEAVARIKGISIEEAQEAIAQLDEEAEDKLRKNDRVKAVVTVIRGERAAGKLGSSDEDGLDGLI